MKLSLIFLSPFYTSMAFRVVSLIGPLYHRPQETKLEAEKRKNVHLTTMCGDELETQANLALLTTFVICLISGLFIYIL